MLVNIGLCSKNSYLLGIWLSSDLDYLARHTHSCIWKFLTLKRIWFSNPLYADFLPINWKREESQHRLFCNTCHVASEVCFGVFRALCNRNKIWRWCCRACHQTSILTGIEYDLHTEWLFHLEMAGICNGQVQSQGHIQQLCNQDFGNFKKPLRIG